MTKEEIIQATSFLNKFKPTLSLRLFCLENNILSEKDFPKCPICGKPVSIRKNGCSFTKSCGNKNCINKLKKLNTIKAIKEKYGVENVFQHPVIKEKIKQTNLKKYGVENPSQSELIKKKKEKTFLKHFGVKQGLQSEVIREKIKQTNLKKYGAENPFQSELIKEKIRQTNLKKYGVEYPMESDAVKEKAKRTILEKYGTECIMQSEFVKNKIRMKSLKRFYYKVLMNENSPVIPNFPVEELKGERDSKGHYIKYSWKCKKCGLIFDGDYYQRFRCPNCNPINSYSSKWEDEIYEFLRDNYDGAIIRQDRSILKDRFLDFYLPSKKLAIEFDGLYWHSELQGKHKYYHLDKTLRCLKENIQLIHIFEDEWINKQEIVKSILLNKLGLIDNKIFARECYIEEINKDDAEKFLIENHLQGFINGKHIGLFYKNNLVSLLTIGKPRFNKNYEWEILRFCNKNYYLVIGAFSKLLNYFITKYNVHSIISYVDLRYGLGTSYMKIGFKFLKFTQPNYYYFLKSQLIRFNRLNFQKAKLKKKLEKFDPDLTEWENMANNGYDRIWDCGNAVFVKEL